MKDNRSIVERSSKKQRYIMIPSKIVIPLKVLCFILIISLVVMSGNIVARNIITNKISKEEHTTKQLQNKQNYIPYESTNITDVGNGWITFEFDDCKFLYFADFIYLNDRRNQCITNYKGGI